MFVFENWCKINAHPIISIFNWSASLMYIFWKARINLKDTTFYEWRSPVLCHSMVKVLSLLHPFKVQTIVTPRLPQPHHRAFWYSRICKKQCPDRINFGETVTRQNLHSWKEDLVIKNYCHKSQFSVELIDVMEWYGGDCASILSFLGNFCQKPNPK